MQSIRPKLALLSPEGTALLLLLELASLLALSSCAAGGGQQRTELAPGNPLRPRAQDLGLPAPLELLGGAGRDVSHTFDDAVRSGTAYDHSLPYRNVTDSIVTVRMLEDTSSDLGPFGSSAFCLYRFVVPDYDEPLALRAIPSQVNPGEPLVEGDMYWFVANWDTNRWDAFAYLGGVPALGDSAPYKLDTADSSNGTFLVAMFLARGLQRFDAVAIGSNIPPYAYFSYFPEAPQAGDTVNFDPSFSGDYDTAIETFHWDFDDNGEFEAATSTPDVIAHEFTLAGVYPVTLVVTSVDSVTATYRQDITVVEPPD